jgi:phosphatidylserine decarboxylase
MVVEQIKQILSSNPDLRAMMEQSLLLAQRANPNRGTNPVQSLEEWYVYLDAFLHRMPWESLQLSEDASFFHRIDQCIGYFYFLLDQPLEALKDRGYWYPSLQYEPTIAQWLTAYNKAWGEWLSSSDSWREAYYDMARTDSWFELHTDRYESPENWHSWNDFFARRLRTPLAVPHLGMVSPCDGVLMDMPVKTTSVNELTDLLTGSPHKDAFVGGKAIHWVLDVFDYHRFHAPCTGTVIECRTIEGIHTGGGVIIWDEGEHRYRYAQLAATGFQSLETRGVLIMDTADYGRIALVAVGIQQVSSVVWNAAIQVGTKIEQGQELGLFQFGGSDILLLFESGRAIHTENNKPMKVGERIYF